MHMENIRKYVRLVTFSHTLFALPFALVGFFLAVRGYALEFDAYRLVFVVLCMVFARNAAMAFNRLADRHFDAANPRTAGREIPAGKVSPGSALLFIVINALLFMLSAWMINALCFFLSPVALLVILGYSLSKRYTFLCHYILGLGLGLAPVGAFLAVSGFFAVLPVLLGMVVLLWVSSFDIIYALQDEQFDKSLGLKSVPARFGKQRALWISRAGHILAAAGMVVFLAISTSGGFILPIWSALAGITFILALSYQHWIVHTTGLQKVNLAFFTTNGVASVVFALLYIAGLLLS
jgi:4-hydroxybenzoate polyprenyltransferase